ncbi:hypothetical protein VTJ04DRAFT_8583 [Mycothermus thermophilus]|uniref:uncharacterized protein n=1 Tax=Humicola insolens TaxID=85995 RepID=UPI0037449FEA
MLTDHAARIEIEKNRQKRKKKGHAIPSHPVRSVTDPPRFKFKSDISYHHVIIKSHLSIVSHNTQLTQSQTHPIHIPSFPFHPVPFQSQTVPDQKEMTINQPKPPDQVGIITPVTTPNKRQKARKQSQNLKDQPAPIQPSPGQVQPAESVR